MNALVVVVCIVDKRRPWRLAAISVADFRRDEGGNGWVPTFANHITNKWKIWYPIDNILRVKWFG